jgi:hypothetical protein
MEATVDHQFEPEHTLSFNALSPIQRHQSAAAL